MGLSANRREFVILSIAAAFAFGTACVSGSALAQSAQQRVPPSAAGSRPNIVFILTDNLGYGDIGAFGGGDVRGAPTPRLDAIARE